MAEPTKRKASGKRKPAEDTGISIISRITDQAYAVRDNATGREAVVIAGESKFANASIARLHGGTVFVDFYTMQTVASAPDQERGIIEFPGFVMRGSMSPHSSVAMTLNQAATLIEQLQDLIRLDREYTEQQQKANGRP